MWWALLAMLAGCERGDRQEGRTECDPVPLTADCLVWQCYRVLGPNKVEYYFEWGEGERVTCRGHNCSEAMRDAAKRACNVDAPGGGQRLPQGLPPDPARGS